MQPNHTTVANYERKVTHYFQEDRPEMLPFVPSDAKVVLDVGCSSGLFGRDLKARQSCEIWGIEMMPAAAAIAEQHLDRVFTALFDESLPLPAAHFDCIIFNDCLEHMENPDQALILCRRLLKPGGVVVASIPNMRYYPVMRALIWRGEWEYTDSGVMDRTHLRFFTRSSIASLFRHSGYDVLRLEGINAYLYGKGRMHRLLNALTLGRVADMRYQQFAVVARPR